VTGANRGIGLEICRQLAQIGIKVVLTARDEQKGEAARAGLARAGVEVSFHPLDVERDASIAQFQQYAASELRRWDILINNAGVYLDGAKSSVNIDALSFRRTFEINLTGALLISQAAIPMMRRNG